jgi:hypothetical protein
VSLRACPHIPVEDRIPFSPEHGETLADARQDPGQNERETEKKPGTAHDQEQEEPGQTMEEPAIGRLGDRGQDM